jgi:enoyl-[acyl-carrier protein] reductase I
MVTTLRSLGEAVLCLPLDVESDAALEAVFDAAAREWGKLDFVPHSIAFCPQEDLHGGVVDSSRGAFAARDLVPSRGSLRRAPDEVGWLPSDGELLRC